MEGCSLNPTAAVRHRGVVRAVTSAGQTNAAKHIAYYLTVIHTGTIGQGYAVIILAHGAAANCAAFSGDEAIRKRVVCYGAVPNGASRPGGDAVKSVLGHRAVADCGARPGSDSVSKVGPYQAVHNRGVGAREQPVQPTTDKPQRFKCPTGDLGRSNPVPAANAHDRSVAHTDVAVRGGDLDTAVVQRAIAADDEAAQVQRHVVGIDRDAVAIGSDDGEVSGQIVRTSPCNSERHGLNWGARLDLLKRLEHRRRRSGGREAALGPDSRELSVVRCEEQKRGCEFERDCFHCCHFSLDCEWARTGG